MYASEVFLEDTLRSLKVLGGRLKRVWSGPSAQKLEAAKKRILSAKTKHTSWWKGHDVLDSAIKNANKLEADVQRAKKFRKAVKIGGGVAGTGLAAGYAFGKKDE